MRSTLTAAIALGVMVGTTGLAFAQYYPEYPGTYYAPAPAYGYYQPAVPYAAPYPPPPSYTGSYDGTHTAGTAGRAYWGSQKSN